MTVLHYFLATLVLSIINIYYHYYYYHAYSSGGAAALNDNIIIDTTIIKHSNTNSNSSSNSNSSNNSKHVNRQHAVRRLPRSCCASAELAGFLQKWRMIHKILWRSLTRRNPHKTNEAVLENQQPKTYPHPRIPVARLFFVIPCFSEFSSTRGDPEVGGGDNLLGS